jgi:hypothetical protein
MWRWTCSLAMTLALQASLTAACATQSLHLAPTGTVVSGSFELAGKAIPLPDGEFLLAATRIEEAGIVSVFLAQLDGQRLKGAVWASAVLARPAARGNGAQAQEGRLLVERRERSFDAASTGLMQDAVAWLAYHDVVLPVPILIVAEITRIERGTLVRAAYAFNPWSYGCDRPSSQFVESVTDWGKQVQQHLGTEVPRYAAGIHQCASALASAP